MLVDAVGLADLDVDEAGRRERGARTPPRVSAPAMQPVHCCHVGAGRRRPCPRRRSRRRPRSARRAAARAPPRASTCGLSPERLITQLEITTSTLASGSGIVLDVALEELDVLDAGLALRSARASASISSVMSRPIGPAGRADAAGGEQHVDAAARAEVEHGLALVQLGDRGRVAAAERGQRRRVSGSSSRVARLVERRRRRPRSPSGRVPQQASPQPAPLAASPSRSRSRAAARRRVALAAPRLADRVGARSAQPCGQLLQGVGDDVVVGPQAPALGVRRCRRRAAS